MTRLVAIFAFCVLVAGCRNEVESAPPYRAEAAAPRDIVVAVESAGVVEPITLVEVKSKASGEILELPVRFEPRSRAQGKKIGWRDGVQAVRTLLRYRFRR